MQGAIKYVVTVSAVVERVEKVGKEWTKIGQEMKDGYDKPVDKMGYTPEIEKTVRREVEVFKQAVDALDMPALVGVVNGLNRP